MSEIEQVDREAAASVAVLPEMRDLILAGRADHHAEPFAAHRLVERARTLAEVAAHLPAVQYDPAPYTAMKARLAKLTPQP